MSRPPHRLVTAAALAFAALFGMSGWTRVATETIVSPVHPQRIVALIPSIAEDLFAIGAGGQVVASSAYTDHPAAAARLPQIATFAAIDTERVARLHPDLLIGIATQASLVRDVKRLGIPVLLFPDDSYPQIFAILTRLGQVTGHELGARHLIEQLLARTASITAPVRRRAAPAPRVFLVLGVQPIYTIGEGSYIATLFRLAGLRNAATNLHAAYGTYDAEALIASDPDAIVADPAAHLESVIGRAPWNALRAVRAHRVYELADAGTLERPGPRYNDGLAWLVAHVKAAP